MIRSNPLGAKQDAADVIEPSDSLFNHDELVEEVMAAQEGEEEVDRQASDSSSSKAAVSDHEKGETVLSHVVSDDFATPNIEDMATSKIEETATSKTEEAATSIKEAAISIEEAAISKVEGSSTSVAPVVDVRLAPQAPVSESSKTVARPPESEEETTESFKLPPKLSIEEEVERRLSHMESDGKSVFSVKTRHGDMQAVPAAYWERRVQKKNLSEWILRRPDDLFQPRKYQILMHNPQPQDVFTDSRSSDRPSEVRTTGLQTPRSSLGSRAAPGSVGRSSTRSVDVSGSSYAVVAKDKTSGVASTMQSGDLDKSKSGSRSEVHSTISVSRSQPELGSNLAIGSVASDTTALVVRPIPEYVDRMEFRRRLLLQQDVSGLLLNPMGSVPEWVVRLNSIPRARLEPYRIGKKDLFRIDDTLDLGRPTHAYFPPTIVRLYPDGVLLPDPKLFAERDAIKDADKDSQPKTKSSPYVFTEQISIIQSWIRAGKRDSRRRKLKPVPDNVLAQRQAHARAVLRIVQRAAYENQESESSSSSTSETSTFGSDDDGVPGGISVAGARTARGSEHKTLNTTARGSEHKTLNTTARGSEHKTLNTPRGSERTLNTARKRKRTLEALHPSCKAEHEPLGCSNLPVPPRTSLRSPEDLFQRQAYREARSKPEKIAKKGKRRQRTLPKMFEHGLLSAEDLTPLVTLDFLYTGITPEYSGVTPIDSYR